jgi:hypothetical protein
VTEAATRTTWLVGDPAVERQQLDADSWVDVVRGLVPRADEVHDDLLQRVRWEPSRVFRYDRWMDEPRLGGYQDHDRHPALVEAGTWLRRRYRVNFGGGALVRYRNERDSVGFHRDRELRWLEDTLIGVLTLGARRPWLMRPLTPGRRVEPDDDDMTDVLDFAPASGDLLVMGGRCQAAWLHAVPKSHERCHDRIAAQWRWTSRRGRRDPNPSYYAPRHFSR